MQKEFKVGDRIKIKEGVLGYYEAGAEGVVLGVCSGDILVKFDKGIYNPDRSGTWYVNPDEVNIIEEKEKHQYKEGNKVIFLYLEEGGNKEYDEERFTLGKVYVVYDDCGDKYIRVIDDNNCTTYARKDQVKLVTEEEEVQEVEDVNKYTVTEVFEALNEVGNTDFLYTVECVEDYLKKKKDPEWQEFQRLKKKFEG